MKQFLGIAIAALACGLLDSPCLAQQPANHSTLDVLERRVAGVEAVIPVSSIDRIRASLDSAEDPVWNGVLVGGVAGGAAGYALWTALMGNLREGAQPVDEAITGIVLGAALGATIGGIVDAIW